jgi:hypothetical protein
VRARGIKPEAASDSLLIEMPTEVRLLFHFLPLWADDWGFLADNPSQIATDIFPGQDYPVESYIDLLVAANRLQRLVAPTVPLLDESGDSGGIPAERVLWIRHFLKHQNVEHPGAPRYGDPAKLAYIRSARGKPKAQAVVKSRIAEVQPFADYISLPTATRNQRLTIQRRYEVKDEEAVVVECAGCGREGELRRFRPRYGRDTEWPGATVAAMIEIVPHESFDDGVGLLCRLCRVERFGLYAVPLEGRHANPIFGELDLTGTDFTSALGGGRAKRDAGDQISMTLPDAGQGAA